MKILAMEVEAEGVNAEQFTPHLKAEARPRLGTISEWRSFVRSISAPTVLRQFSFSNVRMQMKHGKCWKPCRWCRQG